MPSGSIKRCGLNGLSWSRRRGDDAIGERDDVLGGVDEEAM